MTTPPVLSSEAFRRVAEEHDRLRRQLESLALSHGDDLGRIQGMATSLKKIFEAAQPSTELRRIMAGIAVNRDLVAQIQGPLAQLRASGALDRHAEIFRQAHRSLATTGALSSLFRMPKPDEIKSLHKVLADMERTSSLKLIVPQFDELKRVASAFKTPWINIDNPFESIKGFAELARLGKGLASLPAFDLNLTKALRLELGDWRQVAKLDLDHMLDPVRRMALYKDLGFNLHLTDFPPDAFRPALEVTGIRLPEMPPTIPAYAPEIMLFEEAEGAGDDLSAPPENLEAYDWLYRLESQLRAFIDEAMTRTFGSQWVRHQVHGEMRTQWHDKREQARDNGEPERPLITYADFTDYVKIIVRKDNWEAVFKPVFKRKAFVQESFYRLYPVRLSTAHCRAITEADLLYLSVEARRLLEAIDGDKGKKT